jgi:CRISPR-associated exonuclease Cas4
MEEDEYLALSAVFRFAHCQRQAYLFHAEGAHSENRYTIEGNLLHKRVTDGEDETRPGIRICRSLWLVSHRLQVRGIADVVEFRGTQPIPVEYKRGAQMGREDEHSQLALQAICLEEMLGMAVLIGFIYHGKTRRREEVSIDADLRTGAERMVADVRACIGRTQPPLAVLGRWCSSCSLVNHCQPSVTRGISASDWLARNLGG